MKKFRKNNKGFSLVELIIVIAIMAALIAILAPQYLKYVERSRITTDMNTASSIEQAINVLCADGTIEDGVVITWNTATGGLTDAATGEDPIAAEVIKITGALDKGASNKAQDAATVEYTVTFADGTPAVTVAPDYSTWDD